MENFEYLPNNGGNQTPTDKSSVQISNEAPTNVGALPIDTSKAINIPSVSTAPTTITGNISSVGLSGNEPKDYKSNPFEPIDYGTTSTNKGGGQGYISPEDLDSFGLNMAGAFSDGYLSGANSETTVDVNKYQKYIRGAQVQSGSIEDLNRRRAEDQSVFAQAGNATLRVVANVLPEIGQQVGGLFTDWTKADKEFANSFVEDMANLKQDVNEALPIYRQNPDKTFDITDTAWWFDNGSNVVTSGLAFAGIGYATGGLLNAGLTGAARGLISGTNATRTAIGIDGALQASTLAPKTMNAINGLSTLGNSILLNQMETTGIQGQTWKASYDKELARLKRLPENFLVDDSILENRAKRVASEDSVTAGLINRINILTNITSLARLGNPNLMTTRRLLTEPTFKKSLGRYASEMGQEALEETINGLAQDIAVNDLNNTSDILKSAFSAETMEQAFFGAFGGGFQTGITSIINRAPLQTNRAYNEAFTSKMVELQKVNPDISQDELYVKATEHAINTAGRKRISRKDLERQDFENQQKAIEDIKTRLAPTQVRELSTLFMTADERRDLYNEIDSLEKAGNVQAANILKEKNMISTIIQSFENGTAGVLEDNINSILEMSQEDAVKNGIATSLEDTSFKDRVSNSLNDLKALEKAYNRSYGLLAMGEIFNTEVRLHELNKIISREDTALSEDFENFIGNNSYSNILKQYLRDNEVPTLETFKAQGDSLVTNSITEDVYENTRGRVNLHKAKTSNIKDEITALNDYLTLLKSKEYQKKLREAINKDIENSDIEAGIDDSINNDVLNTDIPSAPKEDDIEEIGTDTNNLTTRNNVTNNEEELDSNIDVNDDLLDKRKKDLKDDYVKALDTLKDLGIDEDIYNHIAESFDSDNVVNTRNLLQNLYNKEAGKELKDLYKNLYSSTLKYVDLLAKNKKLSKDEVDVESLENEAIVEILNNLVTTLPTNNIRFLETGYVDLEGNYIDLLPLNEATNQKDLVANMVRGIKSKPTEDILSANLKQLHEFLFSENVQDAIKGDATENVDALIKSQELITLLIKDYQAYIEANKAVLFNKDLEKQRKLEAKKKLTNEILNTKEEELEELKQYQVQGDQEFLQIIDTRLQDRLAEIDSLEITEEEKAVAIQEAQQLRQDAINERSKQQEQEVDYTNRSYDVQLQQVNEEYNVTSENFIPFDNLYETLPLESKQLIDESRDNIQAIFDKLEERGVDTSDYNSVVGAIQAIAGQYITAKTADVITFFYNDFNNETITKPILNGLESDYYEYIKDVLGIIKEATDDVDLWTSNDNNNSVSFIGNQNQNLLEDKINYLSDKNVIKATEVSRIGYLAKEYTNTVTNGTYIRSDVEGGERINENDIRLLSNVNTFKEGDILEFRVLSEEDFKEEIGDNTAISYSSDVDSVPIGIYSNGSRVKGAYLHTLSWVHPKNIVNSKVTNLEEQKAYLRDLRKSIVNNKSVTSKLVLVTDGIINTNDTFKPLSEIDENLEIAIVRNGKVYTDLSKSVDVSTIGLKNGTVGTLITINNEQRFVPTIKTNISPEILTSIHNIVETFLFKGDSELGNKVLEKELSLRGLDLTSFASLRRFLNPIINVNTARHLNSDQYKTKYITNREDKISTIKISNNSIEFTYDGEFYFLSRQVAEDNPLVVKNILENQFRDMLTTMYNNSDINTLNTNFEFPIINKDGEITGDITDYNSYLKSISMSNLNPVTLPDGEIIYNIQKSYIFDTDSIVIPLDDKVIEESNSTELNDKINDDAIQSDVYGNVQDNSIGLSDDAFDDFSDLSPEIDNVDSILDDSILSTLNIDKGIDFELFNNILSSPDKDTSSVMKDLINKGVINRICD